MCRMRYTAKHYAAALRASCSDVAAYRRLWQELASAAERLRFDPRVLTFFTSKAADAAEQEEAFRTAFQNALSERALQCVVALIANLQGRLLVSIVSEVERVADAEDRTTRAVIESAVPLSAVQRASVADALTAATGRTVRATYAVEPAVLGGIRVTVNATTVWDGTVAGRLARLRERIRTATT